MSQSDLLAFLRHGQTPFFRLPLSRADDDDLSEVARGADVVLLGVPWDGGATLHGGARHAPFLIRQQSVTLSGYHPTLGVDVFERLVVRDGGNVALTPFVPGLFMEGVELNVASILAVGATPFLVGGDHSLTLPTLRAIHRAHGPVAVVHFDAHADTSGDDAWLERYHHGTWLRHALDEGLVADGGLVHIGSRGPWKGADELSRIESARGLVIGADALGERGTSAAVSAMRERLSSRPVYVTIDVDALDPAFAPGTGVRLAGGLTPREVFAMLRGLAGERLVGADVVEVCPAKDTDDVTALLAAHLLFELLAVRGLA